MAVNDFSLQVLIKYLLYENIVALMVYETAFVAFSVHTYMVIFHDST